MIDESSYCVSRQLVAQAANEGSEQGKLESSPSMISLAILLYPSGAKSVTLTSTNATRKRLTSRMGEERKAKGAQLSMALKHDSAGRLVFHPNPTVCFMIDGRRAHYITPHRMSCHKELQFLVSKMRGKLLLTLS